MSNSPLVNYTRISPNKGNQVGGVLVPERTHAIDTITIHCVVGQCSVETLGSIFAKESKKASSNYGIGYDGKIGMYVEEKDRSWCSSSASNDNRAITIECASDAKSPYAINDRVYESLVELCVDICKRNGIKELKWKADKKLIGQVDKQNMTVHRWFANKSCPGKYIYERLGKIASEVNAILNPVEAEVEKVTSKKVVGTGTADKLDRSISGTYVTTANLHLRNDAGTSNKSLVIIPKGTAVKNYGYYSLSKGVKWYYITFKLNGVSYVGFSSSQYLKKK